MKYAIVLRPRQGGAEIHLGVSYPTRAAAAAAAVIECCARCNRVEVRGVPDDWTWHNGRIGFAYGRAV